MTNPTEPTFAPVRARTEVTKGPGSRQAGLAMIFKLIEAAEGRWGRLNVPRLVALVRAGAEFVDARSATFGFGRLLRQQWLYDFPKTVTH